MTKGPSTTIPKTRPPSQQRPVSTTRTESASKVAVNSTKPSRARPTKSKAAAQQVAQGVLDTKARQVDLPRYKIPQDVRTTLKGKTYSSWGSFRRAINKAWAKSPTVKDDPFFTKDNLMRMGAGLNPRSPKAGQVGRRGSMEYDHKKERQDGGKTYDPDNIDMRAPLSHVKKLQRKFNIKSGALKTGGKPRI